MNKRMYIDSARQFRALAQRKNKSYSESVKALHDMFLRSAEEDGASVEELAKLRAWSVGFLLREYYPVDQTADVGWTG